MPEDRQVSKPSLLERVSGNVGTGVAATLIAASGGTYLAPLLPTLLNSLANDRYKARVSAALEELETRLAGQEDAVRNLSDTQFKLVGGIVSTILRTTNQEKIDLLKNAAVNSVGTEQIEEHKASICSRVLRDISVPEALFLLRLSSYSEVVVIPSGETKAKDRDGVLQIDSGSHDAELLSGLYNLGVVSATGSGWGGTLNYRVLPVVMELNALLSEPRHGI